MKLLAALFLASAANLEAQTPTLVVNPRVLLPEEAEAGETLVSALDQLLSELQGGVLENRSIDPSERLRTSILLDEVRSVAAERRGDGPEEQGEFASSPYLTNVVPLEGEQFFIQLVYLGVDAGQPLLTASVELIARRGEQGYRFASPLARNTRGWEVYRLGNMTFHHRGPINLAKVKEYHDLVTAFDERLQSSPKELAFYFFEDDLEAQQFLGLPYKLEYNGQGGSEGWSQVTEDGEIYLVGEAEFMGFDPHDLWHNRLSKVKPRNAVNHAVDEGIATLYGGCWGLTWAEMFTAFRQKIDVSEGTDWLDLREKRVSFRERGHNNPTDFMINALFVQKIEREKGFAGVWELLNAKEEPAYFEALARLTGITKSNYNAEAWSLLKAEIEAQEV